MKTGILQAFGCKWLLRNWNHKWTGGKKKEKSECGVNMYENAIGEKGKRVWELEK